MKSQVLHTVWCGITGEAAGEIRTWSLLEVKDHACELTSQSVSAPRRYQKTGPFWHANRNHRKCRIRTAPIITAKGQPSGNISQAVLFIIFKTIPDLLVLRSLKSRKTNILTAVLVKLFSESNEIMLHVDPSLEGSMWEQPRGLHEVGRTSSSVATLTTYRITSHCETFNVALTSVVSC